MIEILDSAINYVCQKFALRLLKDLFTLMAALMLFILNLTIHVTILYYCILYLLYNIVIFIS